jgi:hypothetical protein
MGASVEREHDDRPSADHNAGGKDARVHEFAVSEQTGVAALGNLAS